LKRLRSVSQAGEVVGTMASDLGDGATR
ncbi:MAG: hypothetical protein QOG79_5912, partial [Mycobacterium sp.]|nr:hypothetical protein [Mycobacterium sp.]